MCGICGAVGTFDRGHVESMLARIAHRGPDDEGVYISDPMPNGSVGALGHRRLSIIDLSSAGHQPMADASGRFWMTFNGEVYNYRELREELRGLGHEFVSGTDSETIVYAYREWGPQCVEHFNGMFAFAIWDEEKQELFAARDRLGIKPFYWTILDGRDGGPKGFAFASEIKAFLDLPGFDRSFDFEALHQYLTFLWVPDPRTIFSSVKKLRPGHRMLVSAANPEPLIEEFWDVRFDVDRSTSEDEWKDRLIEGLGRAVDRRLIADVPLGAFLSGGVDSSLIVALMTERMDRPVQTYTIGFRDEDLKHDIQEDDVVWARKIAKLFKTDASERILEPDVMDLLPKLVYAMDEPVADPAIVTSFLICREARETLTVLLSGMGGDELFAGYPRHKAMKIAGYYNAVPAGVSRPLVDRLPASRPGPFNAPLRNLKKLAKSAALPWSERYLGFGTYFTDAEKVRLYAPALRERSGGFDAYEEHRRHLLRVAAEDPLNQLLYLDLKTFLPCLNLTYTDKTSMAVALEARVPFLDHEFVALAGRMPPELKLKGLRSKYVLKKAAERHLPRDVVWRKKAGFRAPVRAWLANELKPMVEDLLSPERVAKRGLFDYAEVRRIIDDNLSGREDNSLKVYQLLTLELWHEAFLAG
ncbi:MAG: asparagine synthase (glutamine-hydrolyzing) [Blastocatellia bacterium]|nr:asparagine synthase (glutamine-hydrolyzing) [Blastocatellia bacterium]